MQIPGQSVPRVHAAPLRAPITRSVIQFVVHGLQSQHFKKILIKNLLPRILDVDATNQYIVRRVTVT